jgi:hypothetical protein
MSLQSLSQKKKGKGLAALAGVKPARPSDLSSIEGLSMEAERAGLGDEAAAITEETPKLGFLQRLSKGLGAFNPAEAILTGKEEGAIKGVGEYAKNIAQGIGSAVTGKDYEGKRRTFADVAEEMGVENKIAKFGIGFIGDVVLDPSTYFGGAIAKGVLKGASVATKVGLKTVGKIAPEAEQGLKLVGTGLQDAVGRAFQYGYKTSKGAKEDVLTFLSKEQKAKLGLASSNLDRLGTGILSPAQREELALKMIAGKRAEFAARNATADQFKSISKELPEELEQKVLEFSFMKEALMDNPARNLVKYSNKRTGELPEVIGTGKSVFGKMGDDIITEHGFKSSEEAREAFQKYVTQRSKLNALASEIKASKALFKDEKALDDILAFNEAEITKLRAGEIARDVAQSSDPLVQKTIDEQIARSQKMADGVTENPYEVYFPFIKKDKLTKFLNESTGIKVGSQGYRKQFKNLLTNENMELDPAKAFFTREAQIVTDRMTKDFLSGFVGKYGKSLDSFKSVDDAIKEGYTLIKEKGNFGKELGYVSKYDGALIRDSMSPEFQTVNMLAKASGFDAVTSLFKRSVTGLFAPFHVRNFVSGQIQNFETLGVAALNPKNIAVGQKLAYIIGKGEKIPSGTIEIAGKTQKLSNILKPFIDRFSGDTFYNADFAMALKNGSELKQVAGLLSKSRIKETIKTAGLGQEAIPFKVGRAIGQFIEHQQKATAYVTALNQGKSIDEALRLAEAAGFDYRALTSFESQIMRRFIPFYSFTRKNIELQLKTLGENPQRINQVLSFFENISKAAGLSDEEREKLPDYLKDQLIVSFGKNSKGEPIVAGGFGTPIEQPGGLIGKGVDDTIRKITSSLNPIIKTPLERAFGKDFFLDRPIKEVVDAKQYQILPDFIKEFVGFREVTKKDKYGKTYTSYTADPEKLHILRNLPTTRLFSYLYEIYRPEGDTVPGAKALNLTTGVKPKPIDLETVEYFKNRDKQRELEELLIRAGVLKEFKKTYKPKD